MFYIQINHETLLEAAKKRERVESETPRSAYHSICVHFVDKLSSVLPVVAAWCAEPTKKGHQDSRIKRFQLEICFFLDLKCNAN